MDDMDEEVLQLFVEESREHLAGIEDDLLAMEAMDGLDEDLVNRVFRTLHTIKGGAGFFDLINLQNLAHSMENILDLIRKDELQTTKMIVSSLLAGADTVASMVDNLEASNDYDISEHLSVFDGVLKGDVAPEATVVAPSEAAEVNEAEEQEAPPEEPADTEQVVAEGVAPVAEQEPTAPEPAKSTPAAPVAPVTKAVAETPKSATPDAKATPAKTATTTGDQSIRVHLSLLDRLMELAGELVLTRNSLIQSVETGDPALLQPAAKKVDAITSQLQRAIMSTRMQTIDIVFSKFRRIVRDLSGQLGKQINLEILGEDVELDKTIIEALGDPLTHLVRNSIDHGLETPAQRKAAGKPPFGQLRLHAFHEAGQVVIEVSDNGAGIDPKRIASKAIEKGMVSEEEIARMNEKDIVRLIFQPGFSTAEEVTDISGRGVGMDVVRQNLAKVGGVADIESVLGSGTTIRVKLPLTLAIIPSVLVGISTENFAIPQVNVVEMVGIAPDEIKTRIQHVGGVAMLRLRGDLLPLIELSDFFGITQTYNDVDTGSVREERRDRLADRRENEDPDETTNNLRGGVERRESADSSVNIVIVAAGAFKYGIRVDELHESAEIVVKPLGMHFRGSNEFSGATILGDGTVALILDVDGVRRLSGASESQQTESDMRGRDSEEAHDVDSCSILIIQHAEDEVYAVPLQLVARIERFSTSDLQDVGDRKAISYRGGILPLISLEGIVSSQPLDVSTNEFYVIVYTVGNEEIGLMASDIRDIVDYKDTIDNRTHKRAGIAGSMIVNGEILQFLDLYGILELDDPEWTEHLIGSNEESNHTVLLVEDSPFFQSQMKKEIEAAGFIVLTADDGLLGLEVLRTHPEITMVLTDIEMPNMDGLEMARAIRAKPEYKDLPLVAVTSLAGAAAEQKGAAAGIDEYQIKLDREQLVDVCRRLSKPRIVSA
ncbi:MAG: chemotaxis protein CheW [Candidatus Reddybacter sp.]